MRRTKLRIKLMSGILLTVALGISNLSHSSELKSVTEKEAAHLAQQVKKETQHAWQSYKRYAWGP